MRPYAWQGLPFDKVIRIGVSEELSKHKGAVIRQENLYELLTFDIKGAEESREYIKAYSGFYEDTVRHLMEKYGQTEASIRETAVYLPECLAFHMNRKGAGDLLASLPDFRDHGSAYIGLTDAKIIDIRIALGLPACLPLKLSDAETESKVRTEIFLKMLIERTDKVKTEPKITEATNAESQRAIRAEKEPAAENESETAKYDKDYEDPQPLRVAEDVFQENIYQLRENGPVSFAPSGAENIREGEMGKQSDPADFSLDADV
jgi:hypothetical protein